MYYRGEKIKGQKQPINNSLMNLLYIKEEKKKKKEWIEKPRQSNLF